MKTVKQACILRASAFDPTCRDTVLDLTDLIDDRIDPADFETLPDETEIEEVAQGYAKVVREAKQMDVRNASPEQFASRVAESYPLHPAIRDLYARFRENQGFQQTRGLIRLMRIVVSRIWDSDRDPFLIATHDIDLEARETLTEINQVNPTLENAIAHDIASGGSAVAEVTTLRSL